MTQKTLHTATATVTAGGETFTIKPFTFGQLPAVTKCLANLAANIRPGDAIDIPGLIADGGEDILQVLAIAIKKDRSWFDSLEDHAEGIELLTAVVAVNKEVFAKNIMPALVKLTQTVTGKTEAV